MIDQSRFSRAGGAVASALVALPFIGVAGGMGTAAMVAVCALVALSLARTLASLGRTWPLLAVFAAFVSWVAWTATYSPLPQYNQIWRILGMAALYPLFLVAAGSAQSGDRALIRRAAVAGAVGLAVLLLLEALTLRLTGWPTFNHLSQPQTALEPLLRNPGKGASLLSVVVWAAVGAAFAASTRWSPVAARVLIVLGAVACAQFGMTANLLAYAAGLLAFTAAWLLPRVTLVAGSVALAAWTLAAPFVAHWALGPGRPEITVDSWRMRLDIWRFASERIMEKPLTGWGLDGARGFRGQFTEFVARGQAVQVEVIPLHTHNQPLQLWLETGAIGAGLMAAMIVVGGILVALRLGHDRRAAAAAAGVIAASAAHANVSFGVWQEWWWAGIVIAAGAVAALAVPRRSGTLGG
jgi:O-antigen ligase